MSEHLTDSNILRSRKIYGSCKNSTILPVCSDNSGSFSANVEDLCTERTPESAASINNSTYNENNNPKDVNSEFCLFSDEVSDYISSSADSSQGEISSVLETASSSNYQRTRKNLKKQLNNEPTNSKEIFKSPLHENSKCVAGGNELKSASGFKTLKDATFPVKQNSLPSKNSQANHTRIDATSSGESENELPKKSSEISAEQLALQIHYSYGKFENPLILTPVMPLLELVKKFSVRKNESHARNNLDDEKIKKCKSKGMKKKLVRNSDASSKGNSFRKKTLNSSISVRKSSKNANGAKIASKAVQRKTIKRGKKILKKYISKNKYAENNVKAKVKLSLTRTAYNSHLVRNESDEKKIYKLPFVHSKDADASKAVQRETIKRGKKILKKYIYKNKYAKNNVKAKVKLSLTRTAYNSQLVRNESTEKMQSDRDEKQIDKLPFVRSKDADASKAVQRETIKRGKKILKKYLSKNKFVKNNVKAKVKSSITRTAYNSRLVKNESTEKMQSDRDEKQIDKLPFVHSKDDASSVAIQNQFLNNKDPIPIPPVSQETTPFCASRVDASVANNRSILNDNQAVACGNFEQLTIPGPSTSSNNNNSRTNADDFIPNPECSSPKRSSFAPFGVSVQQFANDYFEKTEDVCLLEKQDIADGIFSKHPSLQDVTVSDFCNSPVTTDAFSDFLEDYVGIPADYQDDNDGYEFPENFEKENLTSLAKDFIQSVVCYIIPNEDGPYPSTVTYLQIMKAAMNKMSFREAAIIAKVFPAKSPLQTFKLNDLLSRLNFVAFLVIFDEYKRRKSTSNVK